MVLAFLLMDTKPFISRPRGLWIQAQMGLSRLGTSFLVQGRPFIPRISSDLDDSLQVVLPKGVISQQTDLSTTHPWVQVLQGDITSTGQLGLNTYSDGNPWRHPQRPAPVLVLEIVGHRVSGDDPVKMVVSFPGHDLPTTAYLHAVINYDNVLSNLDLFCKSKVVGWDTPSSSPRIWWIFKKFSNWLHFEHP